MDQQPSSEDGTQRQEHHGRSEAGQDHHDGGTMDRAQHCSPTPTVAPSCGTHPPYSTLPPGPAAISPATSQHTPPSAAADVGTSDPTGAGLGLAPGGAGPVTGASTVPTSPSQPGSSSGAAPDVTYVSPYADPPWTAERLARSVFFARAPPSASQEELEGLFGAYGAVLEVQLFRAFAKCKVSRGCGIVEFQTVGAAQEAMRQLDGRYVWPLAHRPLLVTPVRTPQDLVVAGVSKRKKAFLVGAGSRSSTSATSAAATTTASSSSSSSQPRPAGASSSSGNCSSAAAAAGIFQVPVDSSGVVPGAPSSSSSSRGGATPGLYALPPLFSAAPTVPGYPSMAGVAVYTASTGPAAAAAAVPRAPAARQTCLPGAASVPHGSSLSAGGIHSRVFAARVARPSSVPGVGPGASPVEGRSGTLASSYGASPGRALPGTQAPPASGGDGWLPAFQELILQHYQQHPQQQWTSAGPSPRLQPRQPAAAALPQNITQMAPGATMFAAAAAAAAAAAPLQPAPVAAVTPELAVPGPWAGFSAGPRVPVGATGALQMGIPGLVQRQGSHYPPQQQQQQQAYYAPPQQSSQPQQQQQQQQHVGLIHAPFAGMGRGPVAAGVVYAPGPGYVPIPPDMASFQPPGVVVQGMANPPPELAVPSTLLLLHEQQQQQQQQQQTFQPHGLPLLHPPSQ